ncbi:unnamed protein product [Closterium sp. Naga37s-1]|nr:unnamed protein product [Closterium sp. Naga37s-1]
MDAPPKRLFTFCIFFNNTAAMGGGAVNIDATTFDAFGLTDRVPALTFLRCTFTANSAPNHVGGAVRVAGTARLRFDSCLFDRNSTGVSGGAVYSKDAALTFVKTTLSNSIASGTKSYTVNSVTSGAGGAVYAAASRTNTDAAVRFCASTSFQANGARQADWDRGAHEWVAAGDRLLIQVREEDMRVRSWCGVGGEQWEQAAFYYTPLLPHAPLRLPLA